MERAQALIMAEASVPVRQRLILTGAAILVCTISLSLTQTPLGSPLFFALAAAMGACYVAMLAGVWRPAEASTKYLRVALLMAVAFRVPLAIAPVGNDNDMIRYIWDGRVQRLGYNPYAVVPSDPAVAHTHIESTRAMPSARARTPYPPAAQLFFRMVTSVSESARAMKVALVLCDVLTMVVVWRWLAVMGRNQWLTLAYAWNPLVILEVAHSGHIDALGALWIAASAYWLARKRTALASIAFVLAVATKLLPIVLAPLYWRRVKPRDVTFAALLMVALYIQFMDGRTLPVGAVPNVVAHIRFNGPIFKGIAAAGGAPVAAAVAVLLGFAVAAWARVRWDSSNAAAWAWPMAVSLACAPVIYPWYLLYFTPFLLTTSTIPLIVWTFSVIPVYVVWYFPQWRKPWTVPLAVMAIEFAAAVVAALVVWRRDRRA
jgi:hypothetical protein